MLRFRRFFASLFLLLLLCPVGALSATYTDGTYTATAQGFGTVTVTMTIRNSKILDVNISAPSETQGIGSVAAEQFPSKIIAANGIDGVDTIAGATITSRAILEAAHSCINQASGGTLITPSPTPSPTPTPTPTPPPAVRHPEYADGTYIGYANGFGGKITIQMIISDGWITTVTIDAPNETQGIGSIAAEQLPSRIIAANGVDHVDTISGVTITSRAILEAALRCLDQACGGILITPSPTPSPTPTPTPLPPPPTRHPEYHSGIFTADAKGMGGMVTVTIMIHDGYIISVTVKAPHETPGIADAPIELLPNRIISANRADKVDAISGSTITSRAILEAAQSCIRQSVSAEADTAFYIFPSSLISIEEEALRGVPAEIAVIPDGCQSIGSRAFAGCTSLVQVTIPSSVTTIAADAFEGCNALTIITTSGSKAAAFAAAHSILVLYQ